MVHANKLIYKRWPFVPVWYLSYSLLSQNSIRQKKEEKAQKSKKDPCSIPLNALKHDGAGPRCKRQYCFFVVLCQGPVCGALGLREGNDFLVA